jgi:hypothetical protein
MNADRAPRTIKENQRVRREYATGTQRNLPGRAARVGTVRPGGRRDRACCTRSGALSDATLDGVRRKWRQPSLGGGRNTKNMKAAAVTMLGTCDGTSAA